MDRFIAFDVSRGCPYREIVGCLLWIVLCVVGPELFSVKVLASRCNNPTLLDYQAAMKLLRRLWKRRDVAIVYKRDSAGTELVLSQSRPPPSSLQSEDTSLDPEAAMESDVPANYPQILSLMGVMELPRPLTTPDPGPDLDINAEDASADIPEIVLPVNPRFNILAYTDASFAVGPGMESISGYVAYLNGTPISWGSLR
jgi:hypothetical protein